MNKSIRVFTEAVKDLSEVLENNNFTESEIKELNEVGEKMVETVENTYDLAEKIITGEYYGIDADVINRLPNALEIVEIVDKDIRESEDAISINEYSAIIKVLNSLNEKYEVTFFDSILSIHRRSINFVIDNTKLDYNKEYCQKALDKLD